MATKKSNNGTKKVNVENLTNDQLLNLDLDSVNLYDLLNKNKDLKPKLKTSKGSKEKMYKDTAKKENESDKNFRRRIRNERNTFVENVLIFFQNKNEKELKEQINSFEKFYKETYTKNNFELASICRLNSDAATKAKIKLFFHIIKTNKTK